jgi:hypothetical protein
MAITINGTSGISGVDGSAATPALQGSDTNTGISFGTDEVNINTGGTTRATFSSNGNVGIGTTTTNWDLLDGLIVQPSAGLAGINIASSSSADNAYLAFGYGTAHADQFSAYVGRVGDDTLALGTANTERIKISANGNILFQPDGNGITIYSFSTGAGTSTVKYNYNTGALTYDASNRYVKDNIVDCPYGIAEIKQLQPRKYFRIDDQINEIGFIADEVSEVMPEFVSMGVKSIATKNPEDTEIVPLAVNYEKMTAVLTKALKEAITKIEALETRVAQLEGGTN